MTPIMNAHASPRACQAALASFVCRYTGSITTKTTMNMCGTLGPYGNAVTSAQPASRQSAREHRVVEVAEDEGDAQRGQGRCRGRHRSTLTTPIIKAVSVKTLTRMLKPSPKNAFVSPRVHHAIDGVGVGASGLLL